MFNKPDSKKNSYIAKRCLIIEIIKSLDNQTFVDF